MRDWFINDIYWKGFSILMAVGIWLTVHKFSEEGAAAPTGLLSIQATYTNVPVSVVSGTADVHDAQIEPNAVTVAMSGSRDVMASLDADRIHAFVNLSGIGEAHKTLWNVEVAAPPGATVLRINPAVVTITTSK
jgi:hypothetical protein